MAFFRLYAINGEDYAAHRSQRLDQLRTSAAAQDPQVYPYLLGTVVVSRPSQVWRADITSVPMAKGLMYLVAIIDWGSRDVLTWQAVQDARCLMLPGGFGESPGTRMSRDVHY